MAEEAKDNAASARGEADQTENEADSTNVPTVDDDPKARRQERASSARAHAPRAMSAPRTSTTSADHPVTGRVSLHQIREQAAMKLWDEWMEESLGPMPKNPTSKGPDARRAGGMVQSAMLLRKRGEKLQSQAEARIKQMEQFRLELDNTGVHREKTAAGAVAHVREAGRKRVQKRLEGEELKSELEATQRRALEQSRAAQLQQSELQRALEAVTERCHQAEAVASRHSEVESELRNTIKLLQMKLLSAGEREIEHQRKLKLFERLEPIFSKLAEQFHFSSPEEVTNRLEFLEQAQMESSSRIISIGQENEKLEKRLEDQQRDLEAARADLRHQRKLAAAEAERLTQEAAEDMANMQAALSKAREKESEYLTLQSSVADLWTRCVNSSELVAKTDNAEQFLLSEPVAMISALQELVMMHAPTMAGKRLHQLQALANKAWRQYFKMRTWMKGKTLETFEACMNLCQSSADKIALLETAVQQARGQADGVQQRLEKSERERRKLQADFKKLEELRRIKVVPTADGEVKVIKSTVSASAGPSRPASAAAAERKRAPHSAAHTQTSRPTSASPSVSRPASSPQPSAKPAHPSKPARPMSAHPLSSGASGKMQSLSETGPVLGADEDEDIREFIRDELPDADAFLLSQDTFGSEYLNLPEDSGLSGRDTPDAATKPRPYSAVSGKVPDRPSSAAGAAGGRPHSAMNPAPRGSDRRPPSAPRRPSRASATTTGAARPQSAVASRRAPS